MAKTRHNLSHTRLLTGELGKLYPCGLVEVLPGDVFRGSATIMARFSPMAAPVMHRMTARVHHFFVPHRLSWPESGTPGVADSFEDFITGGPDGTESNPLPTVTTTGVEKDLLDYMGLPAVADIEVSALPLRAYNLIYNEWFRDQDLITPRGLEDTDVPFVAWEKDYLTTARPWPQKGEEVTLPLGVAAPVRGIGKGNQTFGGGSGPVFESGGGNPTYDSRILINPDEGGDQMYVEEDPNNPGFPNMWADLSQATAATINSLRRASGLQRFAEARARFGSRYAEYVRHAFGARPLDSRLQRPELLAAGASPVSISEIMQTAPDSGPEPPDARFGVGDLYGHGIGISKSNRYRTSFSEHGYVISLVSVRPKAVYSNGIDRTWLRQDREDFYQRELAHIGQQQVKEQEVYADSTNADNVFGWSDRYAEYRNTNNRVTGEFRSTLNYWHLGREFGSPPALNQTFVDCDPSKRIFNVTDDDVDALWILADHRIQAQRVVPRNAVGRLL